MRSILEFETVVRNPSQSVQIKKLEKLKSKFIDMFKYILGFIGMSNSEIDSYISLAKKRKYNDVLFVQKLLNGAITCPQL